MITLQLHYGEIALKGQNRRYFEQKLINNINHSFKTQGLLTIPFKSRQKLIIGQIDSNEWLKNKEKYTRILNQTFGLVWWIAGLEFPYQADQPFTEIINQIETYLLKLQPDLFTLLKTNNHIVNFETTRENKAFPLTSPQIGQQLGLYLKEKYQIESSYKNYSYTIYLRVKNETIFVALNRQQSLGGLPISVTGSALLLFSGGIDSPLAAYQLAKRGCQVDLLHFYPTQQFEPDKSGLKIVNLAKKIKEFVPKVRLYVAPYTDFYLSLTNQDINFSEAVLFKRFMLKTASQLCQQIYKPKKDVALATGDSLAQVASQTLSNLKATDSQLNIDQLILRPLLTYNKQEVVDLAQKIGTYQLSVEKYKDCCSIISQHNKTRSYVDRLVEFEKLINIEQTIQTTLSNIKQIELD